MSYIVCIDFQVINVLHDHGIQLHNEEQFKSSPIYNTVRYGNLAVLELIVEKVPCILTKTTGRQVGPCPKVAYTDIWANLTKLAVQVDAIIIGELE